MKIETFWRLAPPACTPLDPQMEMYRYMIHIYGIYTVKVFQFSVS